ncbi:MAG: hypothetical protein J6M39_09490 [Lachnospiraceae bacterium]|nr:hypothetical protein [Lachnospiraceae bacterium]
MTRSRLKMCRKALCLIFAFLFSINSFAAVVSDNDGSAFITKAEFDSLKNDFQSQLNAYNTSIDNKIDNAIAQYLAGLTVEQVITGENYLATIEHPRFYSISKTMSTSTINNIRRGTQERIFGSFHASINGSIQSSYRIFGSYLFSGDGWHDRSGVFQWSGDAINYFYQVKWLDIGAYSYPALDLLNSQSLLQYLGGYAVGFMIASDVVLPDRVDFRNYDLDVSDMASSNVLPWSVTYETCGKSLDNAGLRFNVWNATPNTLDTYEPYSYYTNVTNVNNTTLNTFKDSDLSNFGSTVYEWQMYAPNGALSKGAHDWWITYKNGNVPDNMGQYRNQRVYNWYPNSYEVKYDGYYTTSMFVRCDTNTPVIKYRRPTFRSIQSGDLINYDASKVLNRPIYPTDGAPLTKFVKDVKKLQMDLTITVKDNSTNAIVSNAPYYILLFNQPFGNRNTSDIISGGPYYDLPIIEVSNGVNNFKVTLEESALEHWNEDDIIYARVYSTTANTYAELNCSNVLWTKKSS